MNPEIMSADTIDINDLRRRIYKHIFLRFREELEARIQKSDGTPLTLEEFCRLAGTRQLPPNVLNAACKISGIDKESIIGIGNSWAPPRAAGGNRFRPPSPGEVLAYCAERGNGIDADEFIDFYESNGWKVGKNQMRDWKAAVRTWERKLSKKTPVGSGNPFIDRLEARHDRRRNGHTSGDALRQLPGAD